MSDDFCLFNDLRALSRDGIQLDLIQQRVRQFALHCGRRPRILVGEAGSGYSKQSVNRIGAILAQWGFDVDIGPMHRSPLQIARMATENDVHMIILLGPEDLIQRVIKSLIHELKVLKADDILVTVFGHQPPDTDVADMLERCAFPAPIRFNPKTAKDVARILDFLTRKN